MGEVLVVLGMRVVVGASLSDHFGCMFPVLGFSSVCLPTKYICPEFPKIPLRGKSSYLFVYLGVGVRYRPCPLVPCVYVEVLSKGNRYFRLVEPIRDSILRSDRGFYTLGVHLGVKLDDSCRLQRLCRAAGAWGLVL